MEGRAAIRKLKWAAYPGEKKPRIAPNPFCGFYSIYRFRPSWETAPIDECALAPGQTLCLIEINLMDYADAPLPEAALDYIARVLAFFRRNGRVMLLRFLYDWDGRCIQTEPKELQTILTHMSQLAPVLREFAPWIFVMQGLFVGNWGEMHSSRHLSSMSLSALAERLLDSTGEGTFLSVRSPALWREITRSFTPLEEKDAYSGRVGARMGLFNDGMLASRTDFGTYGEPGAMYTLCSDKRPRDEEIAFQKRLCLFTPNGGEVVNPCSQNDFVTAAGDLKAMRVSYLNSEYDSAVLDKWRGAMVKRSMGAWHGRGGYEYVAAHLGYRFMLEDARLTVMSAPERVLRLSVTLRNEGFAPCYRKTLVAIALRDTQSSRRYLTPVDCDVRTWLPGRAVTLNLALTAPAGAGRVLVCLNLRDEATGLCSNAANAFAYIASDGDSVLGAFEIQDADT